MIRVSGPAPQGAGLERAYEEDRRHWTACAVDTLCLVGLRLKREGR